MRLLADIHRCTGHSGQAQDNYQPCPVRYQCARHTDYFATHLPANQPIPRMHAPESCTLFIQDKIDEEVFTE